MQIESRYYGTAAWRLLTEPATPLLTAQNPLQALDDARRYLVPNFRERNKENISRRCANNLRQPRTIHPTASNMQLVAGIRQLNAPYDRRAWRPTGACCPARVQVELPHFIQQGLVADP